uniref:WD_REPEATS_REGION domain-containing protein n=1 Tax=Macrostomum lignano TaxID=282301 RepID=A0A1I8FR24_9PLAT
NISSYHGSHVLQSLRNHANNTDALVQAYRRVLFTNSYHMSRRGTQLAQRESDEVGLNTPKGARLSLDPLLPQRRGMTQLLGGGAAARSKGGGAGEKPDKLVPFIMADLVKMAFIAATAESRTQLRLLRIRRLLENFAISVPEPELPGVLLLEGSTGSGGGALSVRPFAPDNIAGRNRGGLPGLLGLDWLGVSLRDAGRPAPGHSTAGVLTGQAVADSTPSASKQVFSESAATMEVWRCYAPGHRSTSSAPAVARRRRARPAAATKITAAVLLSFRPTSATPPSRSVACRPTRAPPLLNILYRPSWLPACQPTSGQLRSRPGRTMPPIGPPYWKRRLCDYAKKESQEPQQDLIILLVEALCALVSRQPLLVVDPVSESLRSTYWNRKPLRCFRLLEAALCLLLRYQPDLCPQLRVPACPAAQQQQQSESPESQLLASAVALVPSGTFRYVHQLALCPYCQLCALCCAHTAAPASGVSCAPTSAYLSSKCRRRRPQLADCLCNLLDALWTSEHRPTESASSRLLGSSRPAEARLFRSPSSAESPERPRLCSSRQAWIQLQKVGCAAVRRVDPINLKTRLEATSALCRLNSNSRGSKGDASQRRLMEQQQQQPTIQLKMDFSVGSSKEKSTESNELTSNLTPADAIATSSTGRLSTQLSRPHLPSQQQNNYSTNSSSSSVEVLRVSEADDTCEDNDATITLDGGDQIDIGVELKEDEQQPVSSMQASSETVAASANLVLCWQRDGNEAERESPPESDIGLAAELPSAAAASAAVVVAPPDGDVNSADYGHVLPAMLAEAARHRQRQYRHRPNEPVNGWLSVLCLVALAFAVGLGLGHFNGFSSGRDGRLLIGCRAWRADQAARSRALRRDLAACTRRYDNLELSVSELKTTLVQKEYVDKWESLYAESEEEKDALRVAMELYKT